MAASTGFAISSNTITRPSDTTAYAIGDLVANSVTAGSVTPFVFAGVTDLGVNPVAPTARIDRVRIRKSGTSITAASFRVHFYAATVVPVTGDNGAWSTPVASYIGAADVALDRAFSDGAAGAGSPLLISPLVFTLPVDGSLYALIEARGAYTPVSAETFTVTVEGYRL